MQGNNRRMGESHSHVPKLNWLKWVFGATDLPGQATSALQKLEPHQNCVTGSNALISKGSTVYLLL
ncbi:hypothetical protein SETIT_1G374200v2 [Setaria italica]|uniref:Uncharacterized protein n=2 Tax=Setaria TaxID=4554 RepID=A0A368PTS7_SETIT|nr:hypothetical protein SETIT_1G374200v2 [Setaria italica]TKW42382.1 hypothetical protein SEVIR_1G380800v2 [Setaria viridis]